MLGIVEHRRNTPSLAELGGTARAVVRSLLQSGPLSRAELARTLNLSPASLTKEARPLLDAGVITQESADPSGTSATGPGAAEVRTQTRGRPGAPLTIEPEDFQFAGIKLTADAVYAVRTDAQGAIQQSLTHPLEATDVGTVVDLLVQCINELSSGVTLQAVGVGLAGDQRRFDDTVRKNHFLGWDDVPLAALLTEHTGIPTVLGGDVRALAAGIHWNGPGRGVKDLAVLTVGAGVGLALVLNSQVQTSASGPVGAIGHSRIASSGPVCYAGHRGCAHGFLTTAAITHNAGGPTGEQLTLSEVLQRAEDGDPVARAVFADAGYALGVLIAQLTNILGIQAVVLAGDGLDILTHAAPHMHATVSDQLDPEALLPTIHSYDCTFTEWARGAAVVACQWVLTGPPQSRRP